MKTKDYYKPLDGTKAPKFAGIATFMKLPFVDPLESEDVDVGIIGVPWDGGTTFKPGARHAPRQVREQSSFMRNVHPTLGIKPYELCKCADLGDANINAVNLMESLTWVEEFYEKIIAQNVVPLSVGGDHLISLPILRALATDKPIAMVHIDAHTDMYEGFSGNSSFSHGTPFYHAIKEGLLDPKKIIQIGIRGCMYTENDRQWGLDQGVRIVDIEEFNEIGIKAVLEEKGIKQVWLSEQLGKSFNTVNGYVQNRKQPSLETLYRIGEILQVDPKELLDTKREN